MKNTKKFLTGMVVFWLVLASLESRATQNGGPTSAADQQTQAKDLVGKIGDQKVDLFTGSFGYSIPIACAPARNGSEPNLSLVYSSAGDAGDDSSWCGYGWSLDIGYIDRNTKDGFPIQFSTATEEVPQPAYDDSKGFILNLFGKEYKLLPTANQNEYDAEVDTDFLRCILDTSNNKWTVYDKSGNIYHFGQSSGSRVSNTKSGWSGYSATFQWALDEVDTATGDQTTVSYATPYTSPYTSQSEKTLYPSQITYNNHVSLNGYSGTFSGLHRIIFQLDSNPRPDYRFSYRWGFRTEQNRLLTNILCEVGPQGSPQKVWNYGLSYTTSPATGRSLLRTVTVSGYDANNAATVLPPVTFSYQANPSAVSFGTPTVWTNLNLTVPGQANTYVQYPTTANGSYNVLADLVDIDGDGLPDWVVWDESAQTNTYQVQRNLGMQPAGYGSFDPARYSFGPSTTATMSMTSSQATTASAANPIPDSDAWSALNGAHVRLRDINGDGLPDRVADNWNSSSYNSFEVMLNDQGSNYSAASSWSIVPYGGLSSDPTLLYPAVETGGAYVGFFDINGDGLPDRVLAMDSSVEGPMKYFKVQFNTGTGFSSNIKLFGPYNSQNYNGQSGQNSPQSWAGVQSTGPNGYPNSTMIDLNGDGLPDHVMLPMNPSSPGQALADGSINSYAVEYNDGYSFEAVNTSTTVPGAADAWPGVTTQAGSGISYAQLQNLPYVGLYDVNGDGLPDRVMLDESSFSSTSSNTCKRWLVYLNNGHGFNLTPIVVSNIEDEGQHSDRGWWGVQSPYEGNTAVSLIDINGDGLLDRVMAVYNNGNNNIWSNYFIVQLNSGPFPDLLTNIDNGIGGAVGITYKPSTACDNTRNPAYPSQGSTMPFIRQLASTVTESDGINPPGVTTYSYAGGFWDGVRREFAGFAVVTNTDPTLRTIVTFFHQGGGRNYSSLGEYKDTGNFAKRGMPYRIEYWGNDSPTPLLYKVVLDQVDQASLGNGRYFPYVTNSFEYDYPGGGTPCVTGTRFSYDADGNLIQKLLYGQITGITLPDYTFTGSTQTDYQVNNILYASIPGNSYILDHPSSVNLSDYQGNIVQEKKYTYYPSSGTVETEQTRICPGTYAVTSYQYDSYGRRNLTTDPVGIQTSVDQFDEAYLGASANYIYPYKVRVRAAPNVNNDTADFITYTKNDVRSGLVTDETDAMGVYVKNTYDALQRLTESDKTPVGGSAVWMTKMSYPALGKITSGTAVNYVYSQINDDVDGNGWGKWTYIDGLGRPIETKTGAEASGQYRAVNMIYDPLGELFLTTWPRFESSTSFSKPPTSSAQPAAFTGFDAYGRISETHPRANATFSYGANGLQSVSVSLSSGDSASPLNSNQWSYVYNSNPWWIVYTDADGAVWRYRLDAFGRTNLIEEVTNGNLYAQTTLTYDLAGNLTQIQNQNGEIIYYGYDNAGRLAAMADPYLGQWTYQRDADGRLRIQTDGRGDVISDSYVNPSTGQQDALGRVQQKRVYSSMSAYNNGTPVSTASYTYDNSGDGNYTVYKGLLYEVADSQGFEKSSYDTRGRLAKTTRELNINNQSYTTTYTYYDDDRVQSIVYPNPNSGSGPTISYVYFHGGTINQVSGGGTTYYSVNSADIDALDHVTAFTYGNNLKTTRSYYSTSQRLLAISSSVFSRNFQYSAGDDITYLSGTGINNTTVTYDSLHRILTYSGLSGSYGYDAVGTMEHDIEGGGSSYGYGNARKQAVKSAYGYSYLYDLCGNMIVRHGGTTGSQALAYDSENQLTNFSQAGSTVAEFGYAADGARLWKRTDQSPSQVQVWIGNLYEEKNDLQGVHQILYHVFAGGQQVCTIEAGSLLTYYYHEDNLNSSSALSDSGGTQKEVDSYYPFGRAQTANSQAAFQISRRFTGQVLDAESGLYYYNARYYDPEIGRFIQADTVIPDLSNPQSYNRYSYCQNNPLTLTDPSGHGVIDDALLNTETLRSSYQLMTMHDTGWNKAWEIPVGGIGMAAGGLDAAFNVMTLGGKGVVEGGIKEGVKELTKEGAEKTAATIVKENAEAGVKREVKTAAELAAENPGKVVQNQRLLRNAEGEKVIDPVTGEGRRVDHAVIDREANQAKTYETTGMNVNKAAQIDKEERIQKAGGTYIRDRETRQLVPVQGKSQVIRQP